MRITTLSVILFFCCCCFVRVPDILTPTHGYFNAQQRSMNSFSGNVLSVTLHLKETVANDWTAFIEGLDGMACRQAFAVGIVCVEKEQSWRQIDAKDATIFFPPPARIGWWRIVSSDFVYFSYLEVKRSFWSLKWWISSKKHYPRGAVSQSGNGICVTSVLHGDY